MMVVCHVDDLKVSHVNIFEITNIVKYLSTVYVGLEFHRGKLHDYLVNGP